MIGCDYANIVFIPQNLWLYKVFDKDDYRNVRFVNAKRYVNENWGIKLIDEVAPIETTERVVWCDGGDGPLGHPKVYINLVSALSIYYIGYTDTFYFRISLAITAAATVACVT